jgi:hypothetical protein
VLVTSLKTPTRLLVSDTAKAETVTALRFTTLPTTLLEMISLDLNESDSLKDCLDTLGIPEHYDNVSAASMDDLSAKFDTEKDMQKCLNKLHGKIGFDCSMGTDNKPCFSLLRLEDDEVVTYAVAKPDRLLQFGVEEIKINDGDIAKVGDQVIKRLFRMDQLKQHFKLLVGFARTPKRLYIFVLTRTLGDAEEPNLVRTKVFRVRSEHFMPIIKILDAKPLSHFLVPGGEAIIRGLQGFKVGHEFTRVKFLVSYSFPVFLVSLPVPKREAQLKANEESLIATFSSASVSSTPSPTRRSERLEERLKASAALNDGEEFDALFELYRKTTWRLKMHSPQVALKVFTSKVASNAKIDFNAEVSALQGLARPYFLGYWSSLEGFHEAASAKQLFQFAQQRGAGWCLADEKDEDKEHFQGVVLLRAADIDTVTGTPVTLQSVLARFEHGDESVRLEILAALDAIKQDLRQIHKLGFVHTDVRPRNIMRFEGKWLLVDFQTCARISVEKNEKSEKSEESEENAPPLAGAATVYLTKTAQGAGARRRHLGFRLSTFLDQAPVPSQGNLVRVDWTPEDDFEMLHTSMMFR